MRFHRNRISAVMLPLVILLELVIAIKTKSDFSIYCLGVCGFFDAITVGTAMWTGDDDG